MPNAFGTPQQQALLARGERMFAILQDSPAHTYYGRIVGLVGPDHGDMDRLDALTRLQGASHYAGLPSSDIGGLLSEAHDRGLAPVHYARWTGGDAAVRVSREICRETDLPKGLSVLRITPDSDPGLISAFADCALACGVLPPSIAAVNGTLRPACALVVRADDGTVVSCAAACGFLNHSHPEAGQECWWGMLATRPEWRGHRLSLLLGAQAMVTMRDEYGFDRFFTGIVPGNAASEAVSARLGLSDTDRSILSVADPELLAGGRMTS